MENSTSEHDERLPLVNEQGVVISQTSRRECHIGPGLLHPVVHLHVINHSGELLLQLRSPAKDIFPGRWDTAVGGHIAFGEKPVQALKREAYEEIGIKGFHIKNLGTHCIHTAFESEFVYVYLTFYDGPFTINKAEIEDARFWNVRTIREHVGTGIFTPHFEKDLSLIQDYL